MRKITIAGTGVLGSQIAFQTAFHGYDVTLYDINDTILDRAKRTLEMLGPRYENDLGSSAQQSADAISRIRLSVDLDRALTDADLLIEAIPEDAAIKNEFYGKAGALAPAKTLFATNSSTLLPSELAAATGRPGKFLALHFANEIWKRNIAEIMGHAGTEPAALDAVVMFARSIGMIPLPLRKEQPGYISNSLIVPWVLAALKLWANETADFKTIDRTWMMVTKSTFAPFAFTDMVGINTAWNITAAKARTLNDPELSKVAERLKVEFIDQGKLGEATGRGFYTYPDPEFLKPDFLS